MFKLLHKHLLQRTRSDCMFQIELPTGKQMDEGSNVISNRHWTFLIDNECILNKHITNSFIKYNTRLRRSFLSWLK